MYISKTRKSDFDMNLFAELCLLKNESFCNSFGPCMDCLRINASGKISWVKLEGFQSTKTIHQSNSDKTETFIHKKVIFFTVYLCPCWSKDVFCCLPYDLFPKLKCEK